MRQDARSLATSMNEESRELIWNFELLHREWFSQFHALGDENHKFYMEEQWTNNDRRHFINQGQKPYEFNIITPFVDQLRGEQLQTRTDWEAVGRNPISEQYAEGATHFLRWCRQNGDNRYEARESDIFRDGLVRGLGVFSVRPDWMNPFGGIKIERPLSREFMWDIHSCTDNFWTDCKYLWRGFYLDRVRLAAMFPEWAPEILALAGMVTGRQGWDNIFVMNKPSVRPLTADAHPYSTTFDPMLNTIFNGLLFVREFYHRRYIDKFQVLDGHTGDAYYFDNQSDAMDGAMMLWKWWMESGALQMIGSSQPLVSNPMPCTVPVIDQYIFVGEQLLRVTTQQIDRFPYIPFMPDYYDGSVVSFLERGKHRQRLINRLIMYMEEIAGGTKPQVGVNKAHLSGQQADQDVINKMYRQGVWIFDNPQVEFDVGKAMSSFVPQQNAQMVTSLLGVVKDTMHQLYGSASVVGQADYSQQSAQSQMALKSYASTMTQSIFETLRTTSKLVGESCLYYGQYLNPTTNMMVRGEDGDTIYRSLDSFGIQRLSDLKFRCEITEILASPSEREQRMRVVIGAMGQMGPELNAAFEPLLLKYSPLPYSDKKEISDNIAAIQKQQADLAERQQVQAELDSQTKRQVLVMQQENKARELEIQAQQGARLTATYQIPPSPAATAEILAATGVDPDAHPAMVAEDYAKQAGMDQQIDDTRQQHFNANTPQWQKDTGKAKSQGVGTPKNAEGRENK
ncbi:hypothetical protein KGP36_01660 [Patescibacteria group bacterium]|nr:hypothetical protein [Patescibacteria group bacterium]